MEQILAQFDHLSPLTEEAKVFLTEKIVLRSYQKGDFPLQAGQVCQETFFVQKGLMRMYILHEGEEHIGDFFLEGEFASDMRSSLTQQPSRYNIQCLEDCELFVLSRELMEEAFVRFPLVFERLGRMITEFQLVLLADRIWAGLTMSNEERYVELLRHKPQLFQRIPQYMLASYLGITPVGLSKIRKRLAER
ncbi:MAG: Crp/Fnr family transcriptional regulator [Bacteroidota bacterium]